MKDRKHDSTSLTKNTLWDIRVIKDRTKHDRKLQTIREILFFAPPLDSILGIGRYQILQGKRHSVMLWASKRSLLSCLPSFVNRIESSNTFSWIISIETQSIISNTTISTRSARNTAKCLSVPPLHPPRTRPWVPKSIEWRATQKKRQDSAVSK